MKLFCIFLFVAILPSLVFAQSNYKPGYVLKTNGDTLRGYIDYKEWNKSPLSIDFKANKDDRKFIEFNAHHINGFHVNGFDTYISYKGPVSMNRTEVQYLTSIVDTTKKNDTLFLYQVATGKYLTLYYQADNFKERLFVTEASGKPIELKYAPYANESGQLVSSNIYKGQLTLYINKYTPGNESLANKVERIGYEADDIKPIVDKINNNTTKEKKASPIRLFAGIQVNTESTQVGIYKSSIIVNTVSTVVPQIDFGLDLFNNPSIQRIIFRAQVSFFYNHPKFHYNPTVSANLGGFTFPFNYYTFNQYTATVTPQLLFNVFNRENFKLHLGAGLAFYFSGYSNNKMETLNEDGSVVSGTTIEKPYELKSLWFNVPLQIGTTINKKFEIDLTYTKYTAYTDYLNISVASRSFGLGFKYLFNRR